MNWQETATLIGLFTLRIIVPVIVTLGIGELVSRSYKAHQQVREETEAIPLRGYTLTPPCWEVKNCDPTYRENCPAYLRPGVPCWLALQVTGRELTEECFACEVFQCAQLVTAEETLIEIQGG